MPSHRKRIGFLPSEEVHNIIEKISKEHNYSQSKITGILVEEALRFKGFLNNSSLKNESIKYAKNNKSLFYNDLSNNYDSSNRNNQSLVDDIKIIHEYIEFKLFKKIMHQNDNKIQ